MNHRYIDFVPQNQPQEEIPEEKPILHISFVDLDEEPETIITETKIIEEEAIIEPEVEEEAPEEPEIDLDTPIEELMAARDDEEFDFGVVEDYVPVNDKKPAFINTKVEKRPLYDRSDIEKIKAERLLKKPVEEPKKEEPKKPADTFQTFKKIPFINTNLVEKRPLSKTNYRDRTPIIKEEEEESGPVTIIDNEGKNSRLGLIITIILTIILGAAVGTIAFLLMPR